MNKFLTLIILGILSVSCVTQKRCFNKFPPGNDSIVYVTEVDSIVIRDTLVLVDIWTETVYDTVEIPCPPPPPFYKPKPAYAETSLAKASAWWDYPYIRLELIQKDTTIEIRLESAIREAYFWKTEYIKIKETIKVKYIPNIYKIAFWLWIGVFIAIIGYIILKIKKLII
jgi:hypothetical protein